ncbi:MAG: NAD(P)/FAD-dependent oxidoreductase, partial [Rhodoferax sp.]|nr:NAD(P)/FAD-dependent oxidoreductase [Actinomycetota bacterium]
ADRLLPREDPEAGGRLRAALVRDGIDVRVSVALASVEPITTGGTTGGGVALLADDTRVDFDRVLVAVGRTPRTSDLGLDLAGVALDERGFVVVDATLRTTSPRVLAAGDLTGHPALTHLAGVHGALAASNAVLGLRRTVHPVVPRVTFTQPEVASVGVGAHEVAGRRGFTVRTVEHAHVDRAIAERETDGFTRLVLDRRGRVVGATIVGPRAGESLPELVLAVRRGLRARDLAAATHAYPTYGDGPWKAALAHVQEGLHSQPLRAVTAALTRLRRLG